MPQSDQTVSPLVRALIDAIARGPSLPPEAMPGVGVQEGERIPIELMLGRLAPVLSQGRFAPAPGAGLGGGFAGGSSALGRPLGD